MEKALIPRHRIALLLRSVFKLQSDAAVTKNDKFQSGVCMLIGNQVYGHHVKLLSHRHTAFQEASS